MTTEERLEMLERELGRAKRRNRWLLTAVGLAAGVTLLAVIFLQETTATAQVGGAVVKAWEYGTLSQLYFINSYTCVSPSGRIEAKSMYELYQKMGGVEKKPDGDFHMTLYNQLGSQGWEFAERHELSPNNPTAHLTLLLFKRPKP